MDANFSTLVMSLGSSTMIALGQIPDPNTGHASTDLKVAQFNIDLLQVLKEKTSGNLTEEENKFLTALLSDLQTQYLDKKKNATANN